MHTRICLFFTCGLFLLYYITIVAIQVDHKVLFSHFYSDSCNVLRQADQPNMAIATRIEEGPFTFNTHRITLNTCNYMVMYNTKWSLQYRPVVGDHLHIGIAISIDGKELTMRDRNLTEPIPYEDFQATCANPPEYAYIKQWYHTGVHTHCDNIIHVHPWSAPRKLRVTGKEVTLAMWFESVGISVMGNQLRIPGHEYSDKWILDYYLNVTDKYPVFRTKNMEQIQNLWLVDHHSFIKLYKGVAPDKNTKVLNYYSKSRVGDYPSRN